MSASGARYPVSAAIIAIVAGVVVRNLLPLPAASIEGAKGLARRVIPITIVLTGAGLNLVRVASVGSRALAITVLCMTIAMAATVWLARWFRVLPRTGLLIGAGTAICGTSAIVAVAPLIEADDHDLMISIGTVNILGLVLMFALPAQAASDRPMTAKATNLAANLDADMSTPGYRCAGKRASPSAARQSRYRDWRIQAKVRRLANQAPGSTSSARRPPSGAVPSLSSPP